MAELVVGTADVVLPAACLVTDDVGHFVYPTGASVGDVLQVTRVDVMVFGQMPALGVIVEKLTATSCLVLFMGLYAFGPITPGKLCFIGTDARLSTIRPPAPAHVQHVGVSVDTARVFLNMNPLLIKLTA